MQFAWDPSKRAKVIEEHAVDFEKVEDVFADPFAIEFFDEEHSTENEKRFGIIGLTAEYGLIYLVFTEVDQTTLRFITSRRAEKWMVNEYERERRRI